MSRSEWEQGTIVLPVAAVAQLKQALRKAHNEMYDAILAVAKQWEPRYVDHKPRRGHRMLPRSCDQPLLRGRRPPHARSATAASSAG